MYFRISKLYQYYLFSRHRLTAKHIPETKSFSVKNFSDFLNRYEFVYIKHERGGQGKGIYKAYKEGNGNYRINGFTPKGKPLNISISCIEDFSPEIYPFGSRLNNAHVVQEGINSITTNGEPLLIRAHVQKLKGKWFVSGMFGQITPAETYENGIVNANPGSQVMTVSKLLSECLRMNEREKTALIHSIKKISVTVVKLISRSYPCLEYGVDFGINPNGDPIIFEVNTYPGIGNFARLENRDILDKIQRIRKLQKDETI